MAKRAALTITDEMSPALEGLEGTLTEYIGRLIEGHERRWRLAYGQLREKGWTPEALAAACDALNGYWQLAGHAGGMGSPSAVSLELADAQHLNDICGKWDVKPDHWAELLPEDEQTTRQLLALVEAFWTGTPGLVKRLG